MSANLKNVLQDIKLSAKAVSDATDGLMTNVLRAEALVDDKEGPRKRCQELRGK